MSLQRMIPVVLLGSLLWVSCDVLEPDEKTLNITPGIVQVIYDRVHEYEYGKVGQFTVYNDSTETVHFMGYGPGFPFYTSEVLRDTGWVAIIWGWCGTGAEIYGLDPEDSFVIEVSAPEEEGLWRVGFGIMDTLDWNHTQVLSDPIYYSP